MADLRENLNNRIRKLGEELGTTDPLVAEAILLISRTLVDIHDAESTENGEVNVRLANPPKLDFLNSYRFEQTLDAYDRQFNRMVSTAQRLEENGREFKETILSLSRAIGWLSGGVAWICIIGTIALMWILLT